MTIAGLPTSSPQPAPTEQAATALSPGQVLEAKVVAVDVHGVATLATPAGPLAAELPATLTPGSQATFVVQSVTAGLTLQLIDALTPDEVQGAKTAAASGPNPSGPTASATTSSPMVAPASPALGAPLTALTRAVVVAAGTQAPAAPLIAALQDRAVQAALPAPVARAADAVLATVQPAARLADPAALAQAIRTSGIFPASQEGDGQRPPASADLGSALRMLREALGSWAPKQPAGVGLPSSSEAGSRPSPAVQPAASDPVPVHLGQPTEELAPEQVSAVQQNPARPSGNSGVPEAQPPKSLVAGSSPPAPAPTGAATRSPTTLQLADNPPQGTDVSASAKAAGALAEPAAARPLATDGILPAADDRASALAGSPAFLRALLTRALAVAQPGGPTAMKLVQVDVDTSRNPPSTPPAPLPRADAPPRALPAVQTSAISAPISAAPLRDTLLSMTSAALDRLTVAQAASLPSDPTIAAQPASPSHRPEQAWVLDLPVALPGETGTLPMRIWRDGRSGGGASAGTAAGWTVEFAIDTTATGPVHARVRLGGQHVSVALWAERSETFLALRSGADGLRRGLDEEAFAVDELSVYSGAPRRAPQGPGGLLDARS